MIRMWIFSYVLALAFRNIDRVELQTKNSTSLAPLELFSKYLFQILRSYLNL